MFLLILVPVSVGFIGYLLSHYKGEGQFNWKEMLVQVGVGVALVAVGFFVALSHRTSDVEIWNGTITSKWDDTHGCCHSYPCNCRQQCSGSGKNKSCTTVCDTCYMHSYDKAWYAETSNGETAYSNRCNSPSTSTPNRWKQIKVGEPTAIEHRYTNYIKGNPDSIMRRKGTAEKYGKLLLKYPRVHDHYRINRFLGVGVKIPEVKRLNRELMELNADLGARKQVNIIVVVVKTPDQMYLEALTEYWLGGKKNDVVVVIGTPDFPEIAWAGVVSWTDKENMKIDIRNRLLDLKTFNGDEVLKITREEIEAKFVRKQMSDFEYLKATLRPTTTWLWILFIGGLLISLGLQIYFWYEDPFNHEGRSSSRRSRGFNPFNRRRKRW